MTDLRPCQACGGTGLVPLDSDADYAALANDLRRTFDAISAGMSDAPTPRTRPSDADPVEPLRGT
jgi:hypothetical protein